MKKLNGAGRFTNGYTRVRLRFEKKHYIIMGIIAFIIMLLIALWIFSGKKNDLQARNIEAAPVKVDETANIADDPDTPQEGGILKIYVPTNFSSLDPFLADTKEVCGALSLVYEELIQYDVNSRLTPCIAESWEALDENGLTFKINIRKGVKWHSSNEDVTAHDVVYTIGLLKSEKYASSNYAPALKSIVGYEAYDDYTLLITGTSAGIINLNAMTFPVVSRKFFALGQRPIGTGPYEMLYANPQQGMRFEANPSWWRQQPYIKTVEALTKPNNQDALGALSLGTLNFVPTGLLTINKYKEQGTTSIMEMLSMQNEMLLINHRSWRLQDARVRQAIAHALDKRDIIAKAYLNHAFACDVPIAPDSYLFDSEQKVFEYNEQTAIELLSQADWKDADGNGVIEQIQNGQTVSMSVRLLVNDTPDNLVRKDVANIIKASLERIGIAVEIIAQPWSGDKQDYLTALQAGAFDLALVGVNMDRTSDLRPFLSSNGALNYGGYSNPKMDNLLQKFASAPDEKTQIEITKQLSSLFLEELPFINLYFRTGFALTSHSLKGINQSRESDPYLDIEKWYFDAYGRGLFEPSGELIGTPDWAQFDIAPEPENKESENKKQS